MPGRKTKRSKPKMGKAPNMGKKLTVGSMGYGHMAHVVHRSSEATGRGFGDFGNFLQDRGAAALRGAARGAVEGAING